MNGAAASTLVSFGIVFVAELGDKSQLMVMAFAARHRAWQVLAGITAAASTVHLLAAAIGGGLGAALPAAWIGLAAAAIFVAFGILTWRGDAEAPSDRPAPAPARRAASVVLAVAAVFALAELGDKTMLATIALAAEGGWLPTWIGATAGTVAADGLAIVAGHLLGRTLPERVLRRGAAFLFVAFGVALGAEAVAALT